MWCILLIVGGVVLGLGLVGGGIAAAVDNSPANETGEIIE